MSEDIQPRIVNRPDFIVAGLKVRAGDQEDIKALWAQFAGRAAELRQAAVSGQTYGLIDNFDEESGEFDYLAGVEVRAADQAPEDMEVWQLLAQNYAVFPTTLSTLMQTMSQAYESWLPGSNYRRAPGPEFELYGDNFEPDDPDSPFQLYIPVEPLAGGE